MRPLLVKYRLLLILLLAFVLRVWQLGNGQIEHFDEGVYASNLYCGQLDFQYPDQHLYAPPLWPAVLEWVLLLSGGLANAPLWLAAGLGTALVAVLYVMAGDWWDEQVATVAAVLLATNDFAIAYSRTALTDTPFALCLVAGLYAGSKALRTGNWWWLIVATGSGVLAWWTKYNGWLLPAMWLAGVCGWWILERQPWGLTQPVLLRWFCLLAGVVLLWSPVVWGLQDVGGYAAVTDNHRGYFGGWSLWGAALWQQIQVQRHYISPVTCLGLSVAWLCACRITSVSAAPRANSTPLSTLSRWICLAWGSSLVLAIPLYRPYPRLWLPLQIVLCLTLAATLCVLATRCRTRTLRIVPGMVCLGLAAWVGMGSPWAAWEDRTGLRTAASNIVTSLPEELSDLPQSRVAEWDCLLYVLAEPGLYFHLAQASEANSARFIVQPAGSLEQMSKGPSDRRLPNLLITGLHASRAHPELLHNDPPGLKLLAQFEYRPSDLVLLDDIPPSELGQHRIQQIRLWQILP